MIAIDTNIIVRLMTRDNEEQYGKAVKLFESENLLITGNVLLETQWVLSNTYEFARERILAAFENLVSLPNVTIKPRGICMRAIEWHAKGLEFADALHLASAQDAAHFATFDRKFVKKAARIGATPTVAVA